MSESKPPKFAAAAMVPAADPPPARVAAANASRTARARNLVAGVF
jgi:hypothetical protein